MKKTTKLCLLLFTAFSGYILLSGPASADDDVTSIAEAFKQGTVRGQLKTYFFAQNFDGDGKNDSRIWVNGGNLSYKTAGFYGLSLGGTFQASFVGNKDDDDGKTAGSLDADGAVLSEAFLSYTYANTEFKGGRQYIKTSLLAGSGSRMIKESFEAYIVNNTDIPATTLTAGLVTKYQTRTDKSRYSDNWFVAYEQNGTGDPGDFYDIGDDGAFFVHVNNKSVTNLTLQGQYLNVFDEVAGYYADAMYTIDVGNLTPYVAGQILLTVYDDSTKDSIALFGLKGGIRVSAFDIFAGYTTTTGDEGDARVFRGIGQGAYPHYTSTTKSSGAGALEADTESYQICISHTYQEDLSTKLRYTLFDNPAPNKDLDEYTLNLTYKMGGWAKGFSVSVDFSALDYEDDQKDATDLRTRLIYSF